MKVTRLRRWVTVRVAAILPVAVVLGSLTASPASAAASVGSTFVPPSPCLSGYTYVQTTSPPGTSYAVAAPGVVTSWQFQAAPASVPQIKFKVFRPTGGTSYTVVGSSAVVAPPVSMLSSYPIRVPVLAGDLIGLATLSAGSCAMAGSLHFVAGDAAVGSNQPYIAGSGRIDIAAVVEPDADGDGYGDETQDACPSQATAGAACDGTAPDTRITKGKRTSRSGSATYRFTATEAAHFECRITGGKKKLATFQACTSPKKYRHLKPGKYTFYVRSIDPVGNVDATPAKKKLKVTP